MPRLVLNPPQARFFQGTAVLQLLPELLAVLGKYLGSKPQSLLARNVCYIYGTESLTLLNMLHDLHPR